MTDDNPSTENDREIGMAEEQAQYPGIPECVELHWRLPDAA